MNFIVWRYLIIGQYLVVFKKTVSFFSDKFDSFYNKLVDITKSIRFVENKFFSLKNKYEKLVHEIDYCTI